MKAALKCQLEGLVREHGLTFSDAVEFFAARQHPQAQRYAEYARSNLQDEGTLEFDDPGCIVSVSTDGGAYVMGWRWVDQGDVGLTDLEQAEAQASQL